jgi:HPt (histidine-containing phosphotransfer) domain-containing protein
MSISGSSAGDSSANGVCFPESRGPVPEAQVMPAAGTPVIPWVGLPLVDLSVLRQLEEDLGDPEVARSFAKDYISIWDKRIRYLMRSMADNDPDAAMDAVLSLKNSAFMVGGARLAGLAVELELILRDGDLPSVQPRVSDLAEVGRATIQALQQCYLARNE